MKIALLTHLDADAETDRICEEAKSLGHDCQVIGGRSIDLQVFNDKLNLPGLTNLDADVLIVRSILYSVKSTIILIRHLRSIGIKVFDNSFSDLCYSIDKVSDLTALSLHYFPLPNTYHTRSFAEMPTLAAEIGYPVIIKPIRTGKGKGVNKVDNPGQLEAIISTAKENAVPASRFLIQQFIPYVHDLRVLIIGDHVVCMKRIPKDGDFRANFSLGGSVELFNASESTIDLAKRALHCVGLTVGGVDVLITADGKEYILEVNHNPGFLGMETATGENVAKIFLDHALTVAR